jgi:hypothetical protein
MADDKKNDDTNTTPAPKAAGGHDYLEECPDCIALPQMFPHSCLAPVIAALGGQVDDAKCVAHCGYSLVGWSLGLWVGTNPHVHGTTDEAAKAEAVGVPARHQPRAWAADQLKTLQGGENGVTADPAAAMALPWRVIAAVILDLLKELLNKV